MGVSYDYFVSVDGMPGDDVMDSHWLAPAFLGRLYAELSGRSWSPELVGLVRVSPVLQRIPDRVRDALAEIPADRIADVGAEWAAIEEITRDGVPAAEVTALLHDLVGLSVAGRDHGHGLYVASV